MTPNAQRAIARTAVNQVATGRGLAAPWPVEKVKFPDWLAPDPAWGVEELGAMREELLPSEDRLKGGVYFTPLAAAEAMIELAVVPQLDRLSDHPDPGNVLQISAVDPACGVGVFLIAAARRINACYTTRVAAAIGVESTPVLALQLMPEVLAECIYGVDIDPVAVDLAKSVLWLETRGAIPIDALDDNIICGNVLDGPHVSPPALDRRHGRPSTPEHATAEASR